MEGAIPLSIFFLLLFFFIFFKYRLPGALSFLFILLSSLSLYSLFLLSGLTFNRSTLIALVALIFLGSLNSLNLLKKIKSFLPQSHYTAKMAIHLARKQHNFFICELGLILLIPSSLAIFFLPISLKELGIVLILGIFILSILWLLFSNFYLPKIILLLEGKDALLFSEFNSIEKFKDARNEFTKFTENFKSNMPALPSKNSQMNRKFSPLAPFDFAPIIFILGFIGLIFWLANYELNYPDFFKNNKMLSIDSNANSEFKKQLTQLSGKYREITTIQEKLDKGVQDNSLTHYLFPENIELDKLINDNGVKNKAKKWIIQSTDAFSIMPSLKKTTFAIFISLLPVVIYSFFRFGGSIALTLSLSSLLFFGWGFLFLLVGSIEISELLPELLFASFFVLLSVITYALINSKRLSKQMPEEQKNQKLWFKQQGRELKAILTADNSFFLWSFATILFLIPIFGRQKLLIATLFFLLFVFFIPLFFTPLLTSLWSKLSLWIDKCAFYTIRFFVRESSRAKDNSVEEENVIGINY